MNNYFVQKRKVHLFYISYTIYLIVNFLGWSGINIPSFIFPMTNVFSSLLLLIIILNRRGMSLANCVWFSLLAALCLVVSFVSSNTTGLIVMILFIICAKDMECSKLINRYFVIINIMLCFILLLNFAGIIESSYAIRIKDNGERLYRHSLGFKYATIGPLMFMCSVFAHMSTKRKEINLIETMVILTLNYIFYFYTNTRAVYYLVSFSILLFWIKKCFPILIKNNIFKFVCIAIIPLMAIISVALPLMSENSLINEIDALMSYRIRLGRIAISRYGLSGLFGNNIIWAGTTQDDLVDSSYLRIVLEYGWIVLVLVCLGFMIVQMKNFRSENYGMAIIIMLYMVHSFTDPQLLSIAGNPFLLLLGDVLNSQKLKRIGKSRVY